MPPSSRTTPETWRPSCFSRDGDQGTSWKPTRDDGGDLTAERLAGEVVAAAEAAGAVPFDLVGFSLGAAVATKIAADHPRLMLTALTHGVFWSILAPLATRLAPDLPKNRALAIAFAGISLAVVAGVPVANAIGQWLGWRAAFATFAALGLASLIAGLTGLPSVPRPEPVVPARPGRHVGKLAVVAGVTALGVTAHFCGYTYIVPLLSDVAAVPPADIPWYLFTFGLAGACGTILAGCFSGRPSSLALIATACIAASEVSMAVAGRQPLPTLVEMILWGGSVSMLIVGLQGWMLTVAPHAQNAASAVYVAAFNGGIGFGLDQHAGAR